MGPPRRRGALEAKVTSGFRSLVGGLAVSAVVALFAIGCGGGVNMMTINAKSKSNDLVINNPSLQGDAEIMSGKALYNEQLMQAFVEIQSHSNDSQKLYYRFVWYDTDGFELPGTGGWHFLPLVGNEKKQVSAAAGAPRAERAEFSLRRRSTDDREND